MIYLISTIFYLLKNDCATLHHHHHKKSLKNQHQKPAHTKLPLDITTTRSNIAKSIKKISKQKRSDANARTAKKMHKQ